MIKKFEFLPHTSDLKIKALGKSKEGALENLVLGIAQYMGGEYTNTKNGVKKISITGKDIHEVTYRFVEELLFLLEAKAFFVKKAKLTLTGQELKGNLTGTYVKGKGMSMVKAPTYSEMSFQKKGDVWVVEIVLDI
jgi:SHS2 domain-containing protein